MIAGAGGNIEQLNCVRRALSEVKGGGLARACRAGRMVSLIISDVLDDSLQTIASGPTLIKANRSGSEALQVLEQLKLSNESRLQNISNYLRRSSANEAMSVSQPTVPAVEHVILANNATAVDAAGTRAVELGYRYLMQSARSSEGDVGSLARHLSGAIEQLLGQREVDCLISGGEPTVLLPEPSQRGVGGRNQQLALSIMESLRKLGWPHSIGRFSRPFVFLSGGTDGEDGPTTAAGAMFDADTLERALAADISLIDHILRADAYTFFKRVGGLI